MCPKHFWTRTIGNYRSRWVGVESVRDVLCIKLRLEGYKIPVRSMFPIISNPLCFLKGTLVRQNGVDVKSEGKKQWKLLSRNFQAD
jgi:hypothetical protein